MQYDIEDILSDIQASLAGGLNAQIDAINTEKNDGISLAHINAGAYFFQTLGSQWASYDPLLVYYEANDSLVNKGSALMSVTYSIGIDILIADTGLDPAIIQKLFRYRRALVEFVQANWDTLAKGGQLARIEQFSPTPTFKDMNSDFQGRAVGILIEMTIA